MKKKVAKKATKKAASKSFKLVIELPSGEEELHTCRTDASCKKKFGIRDSVFEKLKKGQVWPISNDRTFPPYPAGSKVSIRK